MFFRLLYKHDPHEAAWLIEIMAYTINYSNSRYVYMLAILHKPLWAI